MIMDYIDRSNEAYLMMEKDKKRMEAIGEKEDPRVSPKRSLLPVKGWPNLNQMVFFRHIYRWMSVFISLLPIVSSILT